MQLNLPKNDALHAAHLRWLSVRKTSDWRLLSHAERVETRERFASHKGVVMAEAAKRGGECVYELDEGLIRFARRYLVRRLVLYALVAVFVVGTPVIGLGLTIITMDWGGLIEAEAFPREWKAHRQAILPLWGAFTLILTAACVLTLGYLRSPRKTLAVIQHFNRARKDPIYRRPKQRKF